MPIPRKEQVPKNASGYFHVISRAVRRAFLCGIDKKNDCDYEHRRQWIVDRLAVLTENFAIDIAAYAVMSNHYHLVLHMDFERSLTWSDQEVVQRWCTLFPPAVFKDDKSNDLDRQTCLDNLTMNGEKVALWRERLSDLSWFMRCLNEFVARKANQEDGCLGRFWEGRFKSQQLLDDAALVTCMAYVDLNPVRAKMAKTPEASEFTSIAARISQNKSQPAEEMTPPLLPFTKQAFSFESSATKSVLPLTQDEYFQLVDWTGRCLRKDKRGHIPAHIAPILQRLAINESNWLEGVASFGRYFYRIVGQFQRLLDTCYEQGRCWLKGQKKARLLFH